MVWSKGFHRGSKGFWRVEGCCSGKLVYFVKRVFIVFDH